MPNQIDVDNPKTFPVFPVPGGDPQFCGISIRTYIATAALQGLLARAPVSEDESLEGMSTGNNSWPFEDAADVAVKMADALIERLNKV